MTWLTLIGLGYLPGALLFRAPTRGRAARAALPADERVFWAVVLSLTASTTAAVGLAAFGQYSLARVLVVDLALSAGVAAWSRGDLRLGAVAPAPRPVAVLPVLLVAIGWWLFTPPGEHLLGGRDPGVYVNQGIQIARRGAMVIPDQTVAAVPVETRDLFFPPYADPHYYSLRFMGFFVLDPEAGTVVGQFPHLYPVWIALGYDLAGVDGARHAVGVCAIVGLLAVYFAGAWLVGRPAAFAAGALLAVNVAEVWFGRYANSELGFQALVFAGVLACARAREQNGRLFALLAATLVGLGLFLRLEAVILLAAVVGAALLRAPDSRPMPRVFAIVLAAWIALAALYLSQIARPYAEQLVGFLGNLAPWQASMGGVAAAATFGVAWWLLRSRHAPALRRGIPSALAAVLVGAAAYAFFLRQAGGRLAAHDADALRTFTDFYLLPYGLVAAAVGFVVTTRRLFWRQPVFFLALAGFSLFFFYKIRIVPEHFWMARRFLAVILPGALLMAAAAALAPLVPGVVRTGRLVRLVWVAVGAVGVTALGWQYWLRSQPLLSHVELAGAIVQVERLAQRFGPDDLLIVESRQASDLHVLALPLAYTYGRDVLVLASRQPDKAQVVRFLEWARARDRRVFFLGGGGTDLVAPEIALQPIAGERFQVPEYESPLNAYPRRVLHKEFDFGIYRFVSPGDRPSRVELDLGEMDDVYVVRFHAKERHARGTSFRWTRDRSYVSLRLPPRPREVALWLNSGGRPPGAPAAELRVYLDEKLLGSTTVEDGFREYAFAIPPDLAEELSSVDRTVQLTLETSTWNPSQLGVADNRDLGVMVDRLEVR